MVAMTSGETQRCAGIYYSILKFSETLNSVYQSLNHFFSKPTLMFSTKFIFPGHIFCQKAAMLNQS